MSKELYFVDNEQSLEHHGVLGQKWGVRRYQRKDGSLTAEGRRRAKSGDKRAAETAAGMRINAEINDDRARRLEARGKTKKADKFRGVAKSQREVADKLDTNVSDFNKAKARYQQAKMIKSAERYGVAGGPLNILSAVSNAAVGNGGMAVVNGITGIAATAGVKESLGDYKIAKSIHKEAKKAYINAKIDRKDRSYQRKLDTNELQRKQSQIEWDEIEEYTGKSQAKNKAQDMAIYDRYRDKVQAKKNKNLSKRRS